MSYPNILPANATDEMRAVDQIGALSCDKLSKSDFNLLPQSCKKELLPHLAYMYDLDISGLETQEIRDYISNAFEIKKYQGTPHAVKLSLKSKFTESKINEWFEDKTLEPFHFKAHLTLQVNSKKIYDTLTFNKVKQLINSSKNARSVFDGFDLKIPDGTVNIKSRVGGVFNVKLQNRLSLNSSVNIKSQTGGIFNIKLQNAIALNSSANINISGGTQWTI